jgi:hypothetical protein
MIFITSPIANEKNNFNQLKYEIGLSLRVTFLKLSLIFTSYNTINTLIRIALQMLKKYYKI